MKAYVFSIGEPTTDLCLWSLKRQGLQTVLYYDQTSFWEKLRRFYFEAEDDIVMRVDADIIVNRNIKELGKFLTSEIWWIQSQSFCWWKMDLTPSPVGLIRGVVFPFVREHIDEVKEDLRPESMMFRLPEFHHPRRCSSAPIITGIHGFAQRDAERVREMKQKRNQEQLYDFELSQKVADQFVRL